MPCAAGQAGTTSAGAARASKARPGPNRMPPALRRGHHKRVWGLAKRRWRAGHPLGLTGRRGARACAAAALRTRPTAVPCKGRAPCPDRLGPGLGARA